MNKKISLFFLVLIAVAPSLSSCYYDHEEILYPESGNCQAPANPSFTGEVQPILAAKCTSCHSGTYASGNIKLNAYADVMISVNDGSLSGSIDHANGYSPMPKGGYKLSECEIQTIDNWIANGSANN